MAPQSIPCGELELRNENGQALFGRLQAEFLALAVSTYVPSFSSLTPRSPSLSPRSPLHSPCSPSSACSDRFQWIWTGCRTLKVPQQGANMSASSPSNLQVPFMGHSPSFVFTGHPQACRSNSSASSIMDMTYEADILERAVIENDVVTVNQILQIHHSKFPVNLHSSILDKASWDSGSHKVSQASQEVEILLRKSQTLIDNYDRAESVIFSGDIPPVFRNALHLAVRHSSLDVIKLLLKYGVDPNEIGLRMSQERAGSISLSSPRSPGRKDVRFSTNKPVSGTESATAVTQKDSVSIEYDNNIVAQEPNGCESQLDAHPNDTTSTFASIYSKDWLFGLPVLFLAVVTGNDSIVRLLLRYNANPNYQDDRGNTPLHLCACSEFRSTDCAQVLIDNGARIRVLNNYGVSPCQLFPELVNEQTRVLKEALACFQEFYTSSGVGRLDAAADTSHGITSHNRQFGKLLKRISTESKLHRNKDKRRCDAEDTSSILRDRVSSFSSVRSIRRRTTSGATSLLEESEISPVDIEVTVISHDSERGSTHVLDRPLFRKMSLRRSDRAKGKSVISVETLAEKDKPRFEDIERCLGTLIKLAGNSECVPSLVEGLASCMNTVISVADQTGAQSIEKCTSELFNQLITTCYEDLQNVGGQRERCACLLHLSTLLTTSIQLLKGKQPLHFTALNAINRIIDICIVSGSYDQHGIGSLYFQDENKELNFLGTLQDGDVLLPEGSSKKKEGKCSKHKLAGECKKMHYKCRERDAPHLEKVEHSKCKFKEGKLGGEEEDEFEEENEDHLLGARTPLEILLHCDPGPVLSVLHNSITMHKRIVGARQKCTPSTRWRHCTHHCLQILSARVLALMCHGPYVQHKVVTDGHLKSLVEGLDPNHDPHLLCLILQALATIALNPSYHQALAEADIADVLMQLLLPSDEWYYTNHSTKYACYVKYHAARILVYMGYFHKLGGRVDLFDMKLFQDKASNPLLQVHSPEDSFIELMALGKVIKKDGQGYIEAGSPEGLVMAIIQDAVEEEHNYLLSTLCGVPNQTLQVSPEVAQSKTATKPTTSKTSRPTDSEEYLLQLYHKPFRELFYSAMPLLIHPVIVIRLLYHKMFGSLVRRKLPDLKDQENDEDAMKESYHKKRRLTYGNCNGQNHKFDGDDFGPPDWVESPVMASGSTTNAAVKTLARNVVFPAPLELQIAMTPSPQISDLDLYHDKSDSNGKEEGKISSSRRIFHRSSKKSISKSVANLHSNSSPPQNSPEEKAQNYDILAFQRELINLPTFVLDTPQVSPMPSRSNSVPDMRELTNKDGHSVAATMSDHNIRCSGSLETKTQEAEKMKEVKESDKKLVKQSQVKSRPVFVLEDATCTSSDTEPCHSHRALTIGDTQSVGIARIHAVKRHAEVKAMNAHLQVKHQSSHQPLPSPYPSNHLYHHRNHHHHHHLSHAATSPMQSQLGLPRTPMLCISSASVTSLRSDVSFHSVYSSHHYFGGMEVPLQHKAVMKIIESWVNVCSADFENDLLASSEMKDFLNKMQSLGSDYRQWCRNMWIMLKLENVDTRKKTNQDNDVESAHEQYKKLQQLIVSGELPCSKEEAATLAGIQLHIEEAWPENESENVDKQASDLARAVAILKSKTLSIDNLAKQENLTRKKELIRTQKALKLTSSRRKLVRQLTCVSDTTESVLTATEVNFGKCLPPDYKESKKVHDLIKEKQKRLWHTPYYDNEIKLKQLYIKICKNLPAYGCKLFQVKELIRGSSRKKVGRILAVSASKIQLLDSKSRFIVRSQPASSLQVWNRSGGRSQEKLVLEFFGTRPWVLSMALADSYKEVTSALWEVLGMDSKCLESISMRRDSWNYLDFSGKRQLMCRSDHDHSSIPSQELDNLQKLLHFPEEVAFMLTKVERELFQQVTPVQYIRQLTLDLSRIPSSGTSQPTVHSLVHRFCEVSSWVTHLIITQPTHEDRKAVLSCILRLVSACWSLGNFNTAVEVLAGLKSDKLKPFWLSISDEDLSTLHMLSDAVLSGEVTLEYKEALARALDILDCKVVPFFGGFLSDLKTILAGVPSIVVLPSEENQSLEFISDYNGEDRFMTRIGVGGLLNVDKLRQAQIVLDDIEQFRQHGRQQDASDVECSSLDRDKSDAESDLGKVEREDSDYDLDLDSYQPIHPLSADHGVTIIPPKQAKINLHYLQCMHFGSTVIHTEEDSSRSAICCLKLEHTNGMLSWCKPSWSTMRGGSTDYYLGGEWDSPPSTGLINRYTYGDLVCTNLEEGYIDLSFIKEVVLGNQLIDTTVICKRHGLEDLTANQHCVSILYGTNLSDNRWLNFVAPSNVVQVWYLGLKCLVAAVRRQQQQTDQRIQWLKEQYLQLYYWENKCQGPNPAEAIKVFGGRKWDSNTNIPNSPIPGSGPQSQQPQSQQPQLQPQPSTGFKRSASVGVGPLRTTRKCLNSPLTSIRDVLPSRRASAGDSPDSPQASSAPAATCLPEERSAPSPRPEPLRTTVRSGSDSELENRLHRIPVHTLKRKCMTWNVAFTHRSERRKLSIGGHFVDTKNNSITHSTQLDFLDFLDLFKAFSLRCRKDIKDLYERFLLSKPGDSNTCGQGSEKVLLKPNKKDMGLITRNTILDLTLDNHRRRICDALAVASIVSNCAGVSTAKREFISVCEFRGFLHEYQEDHLIDDDIVKLIQRHEPDPSLRQMRVLSFEGFARYLMDKDNYAYQNEKTNHTDEDMDQPMTHYYIASSHNTYLTGNQFKGESSVELYSQVLLTGCRCVELDCWDGDDGFPVIYHGHTLTTKIPFKSVVEAINKSAFVASPYPVILSIENHCSIPQQQKMAHIFQNVFGDKLVSKYLFELDFTDDPYLPSPNQLKFKILIKNKKLRSTHKPLLKQKSSAANHMRALTTLSTVSSESGSVQEDDDDDDDDDDDEDLGDDKELALLRTSLGSQDDSVESEESKMEHSRTGSDPVPEGRARSKSDVLSDRMRPKSQSDLDWIYDEELQLALKAPKVKQKKANQIARELSDLVVYTQAIKFKGLALSPLPTIKTKKIVVKKNILGTSPSASTVAPAAAATPIEEKREINFTSIPAKTRNGHASCHSISSINENKAKQLCRRNPVPVINHTEKHLLRVYPTGVRIDSSNFNPVIFWAFGIQMAALNYQTDDTAMHLNSALFEQNNRSGYVLKPPVMWDKTHVMYNRFNPWDREFDGLHATAVTIHVISGQYVCQNNLNGSPMVDIEIIGIPVDSTKQRTKVVSRNALNPIWYDVFSFQVMFRDLAFVRFTVTDVTSNHITAQRIIPLKCLKPGYRHVRLRSPTNQPLELATLFIFSRQQEGFSDFSVNLDNPQDFSASKRRSNFFGKNKEGETLARTETGPCSIPIVRAKRRMFFISLYGVVPSEEYTILKVTQDTTVFETITRALVKAGKVDERETDFVIVEEVQKSWDKKDAGKGGHHQILDMQDPILLCMNSWKGQGKLILKKKTDDPSTRAWISTIMATDQKRRQRSLDTDSTDWETDEQMFHVCVYNVSSDQPYTIFKAPVTSTAQDIITQALLRARRADDPKKYVLLEELCTSGGSAESPSQSGRRRSSLRRRFLLDIENVYQAQSEWKATGRFILTDRPTTQNEKKRVGNSFTKASASFVNRFNVFKAKSKSVTTDSKGLEESARSKSYPQVKAELIPSPEGEGDDVFDKKNMGKEEAAMATTCSPKPLPKFMKLSHRWKPNT